MADSNPANHNPMNPFMPIAYPNSFNDITVTAADREYHNLNGLYCYACEGGFKTLSKLKEHLLLHNFPGAHKLCNDCKSRSWNRSPVKPRRHFCYECEASFVKAENLKAHLILHNGAYKACSECGILIVLVPTINIEPPTPDRRTPDRDAGEDISDSDTSELHDFLHNSLPKLSRREEQANRRRAKETHKTGKHYCTVLSCKRSENGGGKHFARIDNLNVHLRQVHDIAVAKVRRHPVRADMDERQNDTFVAMSQRRISTLEQYRIQELFVRR